MKTEKQAQIITEKINKIIADKSQVIASYSTRDDSVQAELRLAATWKISVPVDEINYPKDMSGNNAELWRGMWLIFSQIAKASQLKTGDNNLKMPINIKTKTGAERRADAKNGWLIAAGNQFLADYKIVTKKSNLLKIRKQITELQAQQKALLPPLREANSLYLAGKKTIREAQNQKNTDALKSGRFWEADKDALKSYFHPPFAKNYVADVSKKWRACLILECESISFKTYNDNWGHKLGGTGRGYLCGIDDNGDEWGFIVRDLPQSYDDYHNASLDSTVEEAMSDIFDIPINRINACTRQGDLLFFPLSAINNKIAVDVELQSVDEWSPRESHNITSPTLRHNGVYFCAVDPITVTHTSHSTELLTGLIGMALGDALGVAHTCHSTVLLPAGEYRLYMSREADPKD